MIKVKMLIMATYSIEYLILVKPAEVEVRIQGQFTSAPAAYAFNVRLRFDFKIGSRLFLFLGVCENLLTHKLFKKLP